MNKLKLLWNKRTLVTLLSIGFMAFGIGCISWAMFNIWSQPGYAASANLKSFVEDSTKPLEYELSSQNLYLDQSLYPVYPTEGDNIGSLTIPALNRKLPILQGTSEKELNKGVGHFLQSVLPGEEDNCVLSGHRETSFKQIGDLNIGDELIVQTSAGIFTYEINGTRIVHEDDKTVIVPSEHAVLTMTTCYPFNYVGNAPDRYIISATLVKTK